MKKKIKFIGVDPDAFKTQKDAVEFSKLVNQEKVKLLKRKGK